MSLRTKPEKASYYLLQCNRVVRNEMSERFESENYFISGRSLGSRVLLISGIIMQYIDILFPQVEFIKQIT